MKIRICAIRDCTQPHLARGWCRGHYERWLRHGSPLGGRHPRTGCLVEDCPDKHFAKGYCNRHYHRLKQHGDPTYLPGLDVDEVAVQRAIDGDTPAQFTPAERTEVALALHRRGLTDRQIAERLGCAPETVTRIRRRAGLTNPLNPQTVAAREEQVRQLHTQGLNDREIAATTGLSVGGVRGIRLRLSLPRNHPPHGTWGNWRAA